MLNTNQLILFKDFDANHLKSYIAIINEIKKTENANNSALYESLQIEEYANALNDIKGSQAALLLSTQGLTNAQIAQTLVSKEGDTELAYQAMLEAGLLKSKTALTNAELQNIIATKVGNEAYAKALMQHMGLSVAIEGEEAQPVKLTSKKLQQLTATGLLNEMNSNP